MKLSVKSFPSVVAVRCEMEAQPVLAADDGGWEAGSSEPVGTGSGGGGGEGPQLPETGHPGVSWVVCAEQAFPASSSFAVGLTPPWARSPEACTGPHGQAGGDPMPPSGR